MDLLKGFLGTAPAVEEISEIYKYVNRSEVLLK
jgi:hypothetical protein